jgi:hypothetical protein
MDARNFERDLTIKARVDVSGREMDDNAQSTNGALAIHDTYETIRVNDLAGVHQVENTWAKHETIGGYVEAIDFVWLLGVEMEARDDSKEQQVVQEQNEPT